MSQGKSEERSLSELREQIDRIDNEFLRLLAERMRVVDEIAQYKRAHGLQIRDSQRERQLLEQRRSAAEALGLAGEVAELIYRLIMLTSRDRQNEQQVEASRDVAPKRVAVIGGAGPMGKVVERMFVQVGHQVAIADLETELKPRAAAEQSDVVVICVPIDATEKVIRYVGPCVRREGLLMDVTSIKHEPITWMLESTSASVVGTHPLFGPGVRSFQGQRVVVCPGRGEEWRQWVLRLFSAGGMAVTESTAEEHDRAMALVQVLTHFQTQVLGLALSRLGIGLEESLRFTSPTYLLELYVAARHFAQSAQLYGSIEMRNPMSSRVTELFCGAAAELSEILEKRDQARFAAVFEQVRRFFGPFTEEAMEQSSFLIDRLIERSLGSVGY